MADNNTEKKSFLTLTKKVKYPTKYHINMVRPRKKSSVNTMKLAIWALCFIAVAAFLKFGIFDQLNKIKVAEKKYNEMAAEVQKVKETNKEYDEVKAKYDEVTDWYMTEEEQMVIDKTNVFEMLDEDLVPYVGMKSVQIKGNQIVVETYKTTLDVVSEFLHKLQLDKRNSFVSVTTANASNEKDVITNDVIATVNITYSGGSADGEETAITPTETPEATTENAAADAEKTAEGGAAQ